MRLVKIFSIDEVNEASNEIFSKYEYVYVCPICPPDNTIMTNEPSPGWNGEAVKVYNFNNLQGAKDVCVCRDWNDSE